MTWQGTACVASWHPRPLAQVLKRLPRKRAPKPRNASHSVPVYRCVGVLGRGPRAPTVSTRVVSAAPQACRDYGHGVLVGADPAYTGERSATLSCVEPSAAARAGKQEPRPRQARAAPANAATRHSSQNFRGLTEIVFRRFAGRGVGGRRR